jgi:hypothetical protein
MVGLIKYFRRKNDVKFKRTQTHTQAQRNHTKMHNQEADNWRRREV